jgi:periplasmic protein TonB
MSGLAVLALAFAPALSAQAGALRVPSEIQERQLIYAAEPIYPPLARQMRIEGAVRISILVGRDGRVARGRLLSGHPLLAGAAMEAVRRWRYRPTLVEGAPVEVVSTVEVNFSLRSPGPSHQPRREQAVVHAG